MTATSRQKPNRSCSYGNVIGSWSALTRAADLWVVVLLLTMPALARTQNQGKICVKIDKVGKAPGVWSGILASTQWLDARIIASSSKEYKVGDSLYFGMYVVQGDKFADSDSPRLSPKIIFSGAILTIGTAASCRTNGHAGWVYTCIKKGCNRTARP